MGPIATVISTQEGLAEVHMVRQPACASCRACNLGLSGNDALTLTVKDTLQAQPGQQVRLHYPPTEGLKAALWVYLMPVGVLFVTQALLGLLPIYGVDAIAALGALAAAFGSIRLLRFNEHKRRSDQRYLPRVVAIIDPENEKGECQ